MCNLFCGCGVIVEVEIYMNISLTLSLPQCHLKTTNKSRKFEILEASCVFWALAGERIFIETHTIEIRFDIGPENILFARAYVHFSARKFYRLGQ